MIRQTIYIEQYGWKATIYYPVHHFHTQEIMSRLEDLVYSKTSNSSPVYKHREYNRIPIKKTVYKELGYDKLNNDSIFKNQGYYDTTNSNSADKYLDHNRPVAQDRIHKENVRTTSTEVERVLNSAYELMSMQKENTGLTYSNYERSESLIVVGQTTSRAQFANTLFHECTHLCVNIAQARNIDHRSEEFAYLAGAIALGFFDVAQYFMCECNSCRHHLEDALNELLLM